MSQSWLVNGFWKIDLVAIAGGAALAWGLIALPRQRANARLADAGYDVVGKEWARYTPDIGSKRVALSDVLDAIDLPKFVDTVWLRRFKSGGGSHYERIRIKPSQNFSSALGFPWENPMIDSAYVTRGETLWFRGAVTDRTELPYTEWTASRMSKGAFEENLKRHWGIEVEFQDGMEMIGNDLAYDFNHEIDLAFRPSAGAWGALRAQVNKLVPWGYRESWERQNYRAFNSEAAVTLHGKNLAKGSPCWGLSQGKAYGSLAIDVGSNWCFYSFEYDD